MTGPAPMRRRFLLPLVVVGFILVSVAEVWLLTALGARIGILWTLAILVAEAFVGVWLMRREGRKAWKALSDAVATGKMPSGHFADAALILVGGIMLILPGFITDILGLVCLLPLTRPLARRLIGILIARQAAMQGLDVDAMRARFGPGTVIPGETVENPPEPPAQKPQVIQGEIED